MPTATVLFVDDDPDIRAIVAVVLGTQTDWRVLMASSGAEALTLALAHVPDLVLMDVMMPDMDGPETLQCMHKQPALAQIPVIFLTAATRTGEYDFLLRLGAEAVLTKPFDPLSLADQIRPHLRRD
ncbi:MAG: response regulator [Oligoflexia bacterium]|nr:response regulator [Oligoflexia bacterium]